jgi:hypothetical protein
MTPFKTPQTYVERHFNQVYAAERVVIERCFGHVKRRFPTLQYKVKVKLEAVPAVIVFCFILHNITKYLNDPDDFNINNNEKTNYRMNMGQ